MTNPTFKKDTLFGTDGIRGTPGVYPLSNGMIYKIGNGIARYITSNKYLPHNNKLKVVIGKDTRLSGHQLEKTIADAITEKGIDVSLVGIITTAGLSYLTKNLSADMGIMISASHNKATDNGIKFFNSKGHKLSSKEEDEIENIIFDSLMHDTHKNGRGNIGKTTQVKYAQTKYVEYLASTLENLDLKGISIALDCAFGAASPFAKKLFSKLGAKVYSINDTPQGDNINIGGAINPDFIKALVLKTNADIGIAVDGDGDRGILVDELGKVLDGDFTMAVMAKFLLGKNKLTKKTVVTTVMCNYGLKVFLEGIGAKIISTDVGDKFVLEALLKNNLNLGGEQSGHIIFLDYLSAPDGLLTALQVLKVMKESGSKLSVLCECITKFPQVLVNVKVKEKKPFEELPALNERLNHYSSKLGSQGRILLRYSGTEPLARVMVEGKDEDLIRDIANSLADHIKQAIGLEEI